MTFWICRFVIFLYTSNGLTMTIHEAGTKLFCVFHSEAALKQIKHRSVNTPGIAAGFLRCTEFRFMSIISPNRANYTSTRINAFASWYTPIHTAQRRIYLCTKQICVQQHSRTPAISSVHPSVYIRQYTITHIRITRVWRVFRPVGNWDAILSLASPNWWTPVTELASPE